MGKKADGETLELKPFSSLALVEKSPNILLRMLTPTEYAIVKVMFHEKHGVTAREIQKKIILEKMISLRAIKAGVYGASTFLKAGVGREKAIKEFIEKTEYYELESQTVEDLIQTARKELRFIEFPAHTTIRRHLDNLVSQGIVGRRTYPEGKQISFVYFLNPDIHRIVEDVELKIRLPEKETPEIAELKQYWWEFFVYSVLSGGPGLSFTFTASSPERQG